MAVCDKIMLSSIVIEEAKYSLNASDISRGSFAHRSLNMTVARRESLVFSTMPSASAFLVECSN